MPRPPLLCLGPGRTAQREQADAVRALGGQAICPDGALPPARLDEIKALAGVIWWGDDARARAYEQALARRNGPILPLIREMPDVARVQGERHVCVDTTAAGGNAALLGGLS